MDLKITRSQSGNREEMRRVEYVRRGKTLKDICLKGDCDGESRELVTPSGPKPESRVDLPRNEKWERQTRWKINE